MKLLKKVITKKYLTEKNFDKAVIKYSDIGKIIRIYSDDHHWIIEAII